jgi:hypothetical protein
MPTMTDEEEKDQKPQELDQQKGEKAKKQVAPSDQENKSQGNGQNDEARRKAIGKQRSEREGRFRREGRIRKKKSRSRLIPPPSGDESSSGSEPGSSFLSLGSRGGSTPAPTSPPMTRKLMGTSTRSPPAWPGRLRRSMLKMTSR